MGLMVIHCLLNGNGRLTSMKNGLISTEEKDLYVYTPTQFPKIIKVYGMFLI